MKRLKLLTLMFVFAGLLAGCSRDNELFDQNDNLMLKKASMGEVFKVMPSGGDDTQALNDAFDAAIAEGAGSVVQLCEGEYHLGFIEVRDFYGCLKGVGKDKTIITVNTGLDGQALIDQGLFPDLVKFVGGDVQLSDFTIRTPPGRICDTGPLLGSIYSMLSFSANNAQYELGNEERSINVIIDNVAVKGQYWAEGPGYYQHNFNCLFGVRTGRDVMLGSDLPREKIDIEVTNSEFDELCYGVLLEAMNNSKAVIGRNNAGNCFTNNDKAGGMYECRATDFLFEGNKVNIPEFCYGWDVDDASYYGILKYEPEVSTSLANIQFNTFNLVHSQYALRFYNARQFLFAEVPVACQVKNNQFNMTDEYDWAIKSTATKGMVIRNNKFTGHGGLAMHHHYSTNGLILGNNLSNVTLEIGAIYFSPTTSNWNVVGGDLGEQVINLGTGNVITGMNVSDSDLPLGRNISESLTTMNHLMH